LRSLQPTFTELEGSLPCSQEIATRPYLRHNLDGFKRATKQTKNQTTFNLTTGLRINFILLSRVQNFAIIVILSAHSTPQVS